MLTVLITRGQIIIRAGDIPARCLCHMEATALSGLLSGTQAGGGRQGGERRELILSPSQRSQQQS